MERTCTKCEKTKPETFEYFPKSHTCAGGINTICRACASETTKLWREAHKDKVKENSAITYRRRREKLGLAPRPPAAVMTPEERRTKVRARYKERREEILIITRARRDCQSYKDAHAIRACNLRAHKKFNAPGALTVQDWQDVLKAAGHMCLACGTKQKLTIDHVVPMSVGGANAKDNIQPLCLSCNGRKGNKTMDYRRAGAYPLIIY